jgi:hypothetical protein
LRRLFSNEHATDAFGLFFLENTAVHRAVFWGNNGLGKAAKFDISDPSRSLFLACGFIPVALLAILLRMQGGSLFRIDSFILPSVDASLFTIVRAF